MAFITIYHNPACGTSRNTRALIRHAGINRPIVVTLLGTRLCRPSETVLEILPVDGQPPLVKEDGEVVTDQGVRRG
jgi:arsenate reductase (glutaredoxin)